MDGQSRGRLDSDQHYACASATPTLARQQAEGKKGNERAENSIHTCSLAIGHLQRRLCLDHLGLGLCRLHARHDRGALGLRPPMHLCQHLQHIAQESQPTTLEWVQKRTQRHAP
jgi:hypothetical protein